MYHLGLSCTYGSSFWELYLLPSEKLNFQDFGKFYIDYKMVYLQAAMTTTADQSNAGPSYMQQDTQNTAIASPESSTASEGRYCKSSMLCAVQHNLALTWQHINMKQEALT